jgi:hypothetical protein
MNVTKQKISGNHEKMKEWLLILQQCTSGGTPKEGPRENWQVFRSCMTDNFKKIEAMLEARKLVFQDEHSKILLFFGVTPERFARYKTDMKNMFKPFAGYLNAMGGYNIPKGSVEKRFHATVKRATEEYQDVSKAGEAWTKLQREMLDENLEVELFCCDYDEVPDTINCAWISFLDILLMGRPRIRFWHKIMVRNARDDKEYAARLLAKNAEAIKSALQKLDYVVPDDHALKIALASHDSVFVEKDETPEVKP